MPDITYTYDDLGRLASVLDVDGDVGIYTYDAVGNLLSIKRQRSSVVTLIEFTPKSAPVGTSLTIYGAGFSKVLSENTVTFNNIPATIISATGTRIVATVPPGAASGPITITTPTGSATSVSSFAVNPASQVPAIAAFTPALGGPGAVVTITGTNFDTKLANNKAMFNRVLAILSSATTTAIQTEVPPGTGSGRIAVSTPLGTAISEDFFIPPSPYSVADVEFTGRIELGESEACTIGTPNKISLLVFEGIAGQRLSLGVSEVTFGNVTGVFQVSILHPRGTTLGNKLVGGPDAIEMGPLPDTGTYTVVVDPGVLTVGLTLTVSEPVTGIITTDGPSIPITLSRPGQHARMTFDSTAGQQLDLGVSEVSFGQGSGSAVVEVSVLDPGGTVLASGFVTSPGRGIHPDPLPDTGTYTIVIEPQEATTVGLILTLSTPLAATITVDGPSVPIALRPGQNARLTFDGTSGQRISLGVTEVSFGGGSSAILSILEPNGTTLVSSSVRDNGGDLDADSLPDTGSYTVVVDPGGSSFDPEATTASLALTLSDPVTGTIIIGGSTVPIVLNRPGQNAQLTFNGTAGQRVSLGVSEVSFNIEGAVTGGNVSILRSNGTILASNSISTDGSDIDLEPLPDTATYTILVNPPGVLTVSLTLTLSEPIAGTLAMDGPSVSVTLNRPGQDARLTFEGTAGQQVRLGVEEVSFNTSLASVIVTILSPQATALISLIMDANGGNVDINPLPDTGTYEVVINPQATSDATVTLSLAQIA